MRTLWTLECEISAGSLNMWSLPPPGGHLPAYKLKKRDIGSRGAVKFRMTSYREAKGLNTCTFFHLSGESRRARFLPANFSAVLLLPNSQRDSLNSPCHEDGFPIQACQTGSLVSDQRGHLAYRASETRGVSSAGGNSTRAQQLGIHKILGCRNI